MRSQTTKDVLTTGQVARICHVAPRTVSKWFDTGRLRGYRIPGSRDRRIPISQLRAFMRAHNMPLDELDGGRCRVMVLDATARQSEIAPLNETGHYDVRTAANGFEAGVLAQQFRPHVIVLATEEDTDEAMDLCDRIRRSADLQSTRVIAATSGLTPQRRQWFLARGFDGCLPRPFSQEQLRDAVEAVTNLLE
jgi:excisionase family DNA binding protein